MTWICISISGTRQVDKTVSDLTLRIDILYVMHTRRSVTSTTVVISCPAAAAAVEEDVDGEAGAGRAIVFFAQPGGYEGGNLARCIISSLVVCSTSKRSLVEDFHSH